ncbi:hypothetical protein [Nocardia puris]|uniref:hypothetical protein n=1 Tax=Nocardia puris TaxID=208602 RepID=UPI002E1C8155
MEREHEDAMRADFREYAATVDTPISPADEHAQARKRGAEVASRWRSGPFRQEWDELVEFDIQYRRWPSDALAARDEQRSYPDYPSTVEDRSREQATELAFQRDPRLRQISAGYVEWDGTVVFDGRTTGREYPASARPDGVEALTPRSQVTRER